MKKAIITAFILLILLSLGCAPGPNDAIFSEHGRDIAGFWLGLWHGLISLVTFVISLFNKNVSMYEVYNNGAWYNLGFLLGVMTAFGGGQKSAKRKKKRCCPANDE